MSLSIPKNGRANAILKCLNRIHGQKKDHYRIIEIGTMFSEKEGYSTLVMARFLKSHGLTGTIHTIDNNPDHLRRCKQIITKFDSSLLQYVDFCEGYSTDILPNLLTNTITFAFVDGGAHPEVNLIEFQQIYSKLDPDGLILIDDVNQMKRSSAYNLHRDFGKGHLILPYLIINNYINNFNRLPQETQDQVAEHSSFIKRIKGEHFDVPDYKLIGGRLLVCGRSELLGAL